MDTPLDQLLETTASLFEEQAKAHWHETESAQVKAEWYETAARKLREGRK